MDNLLAEISLSLDLSHASQGTILCCALQAGVMPPAPAKQGPSCGINSSSSGMQSSHEIRSSTALPLASLTTPLPAAAAAASMVLPRNTAAAAVVAETTIAAARSGGLTDPCSLQCSPASIFGSADSTTHTAAAGAEAEPAAADAPGAPEAARAAESDGAPEKVAAEAVHMAVEAAAAVTNRHGQSGPPSSMIVLSHLLQTFRENSIPQDMSTAIQQQLVTFIDRQMVNRISIVLERQGNSNSSRGCEDTGWAVNVSLSVLEVSGGCAMVSAAAQGLVQLPVQHLIWQLICLQIMLTLREEHGSAHLFECYGSSMHRPEVI